MEENKRYYFDDDDNIEKNIKRLRSAAKYSDKDTVQRLLKYWNDQSSPGKFKLDVHDNSILHLCVGNDNHVLDIMTLLIKRGADINCTNLYGQTPLHLALELDNCNLAIIKLLLKSGADIKVGNVSNSSPLHYAVQKKGCLPDVISLLINHGADIEAQNNLGDTALLRALRNSNCPIEIINRLLACGASVTAKNKFGRSVLHSAVQGKDCCPAVIKLLLKKGAPINVLNSGNKSPLYLAIEHNCSHEVVLLLLNNGADINYGESSFEKVIGMCNQNCCCEAIELCSCDETCNMTATRSLLLILRFAILRDSSLDIHQYIDSSKHMIVLEQFALTCQHEAIAMGHEEIAKNTTLREYLAGSKPVRFTTEEMCGELAEITKILHLLAVSKYPTYKDIIIGKLEFEKQHIFDKLFIYAKDNYPTAKAIWLDPYVTAKIGHLLSDEDVVHSALACHCAKICNFCSMSP